MGDEKLYLKFKCSDLVESWLWLATLFSLLRTEGALRGLYQ